MKGTALLKATVCLSGWVAAAWLLFSKPLEPLSLPAPKERGTPMPPPATVNPIESTFLEWSADPALAGALVGFCVLDEAGEPLFASPLAATALCPASALKTVTTASAFELLGPEFRFETKLFGTGPVRDGVLSGDLRLMGGGDPTFSAADLERMAGELVRSGLKQVNGTLLVDTEGLNGNPVNDHWNWGDIGNAYGAGAFRLNLDHNRIVLRFKPGASYEAPAVLLNESVATKDTRWINGVITGAPGSGDQVMAYSDPYGRTIRLSGSVPEGPEEFTVGAALPDPPARVRELLLDRLAASGIKVLGREVVHGDLKRILLPTDFARHLSVPLPEIIDHLHRVSDNLEAQCLFHAIRGNSEWEIRQHWGNRGCRFVGLRLIDGSGLARANMIRPLDLAKVNHLARRGPHGERFRQSLTSYLDGKVRSKLGAMSGVRTEVGFLTLDDGREVTFALMANGLGLDVDFWPLREKLLREVASELNR